MIQINDGSEVAGLAYAPQSFLRGWGLQVPLNGPELVRITTNVVGLRSSWPNAPSISHGPGYSHALHTFAIHDIDLAGKNTLHHIALSTT
ncbi:hypothetical protein HBH56_071480 [Parastagonospora nodorum]|nr:hypothetical protein HBH56_071480 [Parastagonospora nodorum]KAH3986093.1 hypothetical protein HBH52_048870 [Parastagonospora nodorum]KAH4040696.1 hypothetical protein HBI09_031230 [Parastagonospora nodorum]KAH4109460.1 hypothetical protein HBH46_031870 [Parastagonospora nodorum]KAH4165938.1 hypothetical protein HBH44_071710 [Parastagonospora nodorum]